uniref:Fe_hyd_lg_C domain-containing protein n=1 Tax=Angiostrongylus cantonensis TaxID=6313 RepID=A0A0K0CWG3_ANGCA
MKFIFSPETDNCGFSDRRNEFMHDTTVAALLTTFGDEQAVIRGGLPKYTASVAVELWMLEEGPAVKILFHGAFHHNYHTITHLTKGCPEDNEFCPLKNFFLHSFQPNKVMGPRKAANNEY